MAFANQTAPRTGVQDANFYFLTDFLVGQSPFVLFCLGCWRSSLNLISYNNFMRLLFLIDNAVGKGEVLSLPLVD